MISRSIIVVALMVIATNAIAQLPILTITSPTFYSMFGRSLSDAGDVDGDGVSDFIVGMPGDHSFGGHSGKAIVYSGADRSILYEFFGSGDLDQLGFSVSGAGDVNEDGYADLFISALGAGSGTERPGKASVYSGYDGSLLHLFEADGIEDLYGYSVSDTGDVDGDGVGDLIVGCPFNDQTTMNAGSAYVFSGKTGDLIHSFFGETNGGMLGASVSGAGDVDNDGRADLIVGAVSEVTGLTSRAGRVKVFSGRTGDVIWSHDGDVHSSAFGKHVSELGDVNGDGHADYVVGAPNLTLQGDASGLVRVFSGIDGTVLYTVNGDSARDMLGHSLDSVSDVDGDGIVDIIASAVGNEDNGVRSGAVRLLSGADGSVIYSVYGDEEHYLGAYVAGIGDFNNDGIGDYIISTAGAWDVATPPTVIVYSGIYVPVDVPTLLGNLLEDVVSLNLNSGIENSLDAKLDAVFTALGDVNSNNDVAAINALEAFINAVAAQIGNKIAVADADALIAAAQAIIDLLIEA